MTAIILDTETTGLDEPEVIQLAWRGPIAEPGLISDLSGARLFKPSKSITLGARAMHHILDEDLEGRPPWVSPWPAPDSLRGVQYVVGHNVDFDWKAIGQPPWKRICTLALARSLWPANDSHSLGACIYHVMQHAIARKILRDAHDAVTDVQLTEILLNRMLEGMENPPETWEELWQFSERARVPKVMPFGKHKGTPIAQVPSDYKRWLLNQPDVDPYLMKALRG